MDTVSEKDSSEEAVATTKEPELPVLTEVSDVQSTFNTTNLEIPDITRDEANSPKSGGSDDVAVMTTPRNGDEQEEEEGETFCDGPGARTRSKVTPEESYPEHISAPSFLVQIPFYALKKEKNRKCSVCGKHGRTPSDLLRHMRVHTGERPFPCIGCEKKFKCKRSQLTHQYLTHGIKEGLSNHRLQVLELKKMRNRPSKSYTMDYDLPPVLESQIAVAPSQQSDTECNNNSSVKQPSPPDMQDEDTEILEGEDNPVTLDVKTDFSGIFSSTPKSEVDLPRETEDQAPITTPPVSKVVNDQESNDFEETAKDCTFENMIASTSSATVTSPITDPIYTIKTSNTNTIYTLSTICNGEDRNDIGTNRNDIGTNRNDIGTNVEESPLPQQQHIDAQNQTVDLTEVLPLPEPKVPVLHIKTHKCTHCTRQFRSIYTLRYHLRSMHDEKVYLSPALESRLKKRRWLPPHVRLQKSKQPPPTNATATETTTSMTTPMSKYKHKNSSKEVKSFESAQNEPDLQAEKVQPHIPVFSSTFHDDLLHAEALRFNQLNLARHHHHKQVEDHKRKSVIIPQESSSRPTIKTEKQDPILDAINAVHIAQSTDLNNNSTLRNILTSKESLFNQLHQYTSNLASQIPVCTSSNMFVDENNKPIENPYLVPPHIFLPSNSQLEEGLENSKPVSWESLTVTSENVLVTKMEAVHPATQQKYVLYKCSQCGKAFSGLRAISVHLASHNDNTGKECEKCGASFKWQAELDTHLECHRAERKYMPSSQFLPSYYVNPFPIPVLPTTNDQTAVMPTTGLLSYPFFPMPQQIPPLVQPGFYPFFAAAALQPPSQVPVTGGETGPNSLTQPPTTTTTTTSSSATPAETLSSSTVSSSIVTPTLPTPRQQPQTQPVQLTTASTANQSAQPNLSVRSSPDSTKDNADTGAASPQNCSFQCKVCPKTFDRIFSLQRHERIHSGVKACFCKTCGRGFSELRNLRHHILRFHADTAKMEPLPYRRHPTRVKNSSQRLVSFLKKTAVKILNSMGQNKAELPAGCARIHAGRPPNTNKNEEQDVPENLTCKKTEAQQKKQDNECKEQKCTETNHKEDHNPAANAPDGNSPSSASSAINFLQVPEVKDLPTLNGSSALNNLIKNTNSQEKTETNKQTVVLQDPKRSLLGNRRKGRPFKLTTNTSTCNFLNPIAEESLYAITQKILNSMPKLNVEAHTAFLQHQAALGETVPNEFVLQQLNYFATGGATTEPQLNEPLDMTSTRESSKIPQEIKSEPDLNGDSVSISSATLSPSAQSFALVGDAVGALTTDMNALQSSEGKCMFPCSYCQRSFNSLSDLNRHMAFHADIRPFKCPYCSYCSRTNSQLKVHMMRHEGIKHYMCQICNYNGVTQSDLNRHLKTRTHLLRSRNICACCGTGFHTRSLSEEHFKSCSLLASANGQDPSKGQDSASKIVIENRNRGNRLKHVQKPKDETMKSDFFQKLCEMRNMGIPFAEFIQPSNTANVVK